MLHVWNIYQHLPYKWPSFVGTVNILYVEHMGIFTCSIENLMNQLTTGTAMASSLGEFLGWGQESVIDAPPGPLRTSMDTVG